MEDPVYLEFTLSHSNSEKANSKGRTVPTNALRKTAFYNISNLPPFLVV